MASQINHLFGHISSPKSVEKVLSELPMPVFSAFADEVRESGKGKVRLGYQAVEKILGEFNTRHQGTGDCTAMGTAGVIDGTKCVQILNGLSEEFLSETATEPIYGLGRIEIGRGQFGSGAGCTGAYVAQAVQKYGTLRRQKYEGLDLTTYSARMADRLGMTGLPDNLEPTAKEHPIKTISLVENYDDLIDLLYNWYFVTVASGQGFYTDQYGRIVLDDEGFAYPRGSWPHQMHFTGFDDSYKRPGVICQNSWGDCCVGGKRYKLPKGAFFIDKAIVNRMLSERDSWVYSTFIGYKKQKIDWGIF